MKYLFYIFIFVFCIKVIGQESNFNSGVVKYKFEQNGYADNIYKKENNDFFKKLYKDTKDIKLVLTFNENESLFEVEKKMDSDISPMTLTVAKRMVAKGSHYTNIKENLVLRKAHNGGEEFLISIKTSNWNITKESKMINSIKCFKATKNKIIENKKGTHIFEIVAWFAPEIPVRFGPKEYNNLPGLILELHDTHHTFFVDDIKFLKRPTKIIPFKGNILTEEEYLDISNRNLKAFRESIKG